jgi:hypothetical protein
VAASSTPNACSRRRLPRAQQRHDHRPSARSLARSHRAHGAAATLVLRHDRSKPGAARSRSTATAASDASSAHRSAWTSRSTPTCSPACT